jgi:hypothetical protein
MSMRAPHSEQASPRVWSCPRCGYVELVHETHLGRDHEDVAAGVEQLELLPVQPILPEELVVAGIDVPDATSEAPADLVWQEAPAVEIAASDLQELADEPAAIEEAPVADAAASELQELADEAAALEEAPVADAAASNILEVEQVAATDQLEPLIESTALEEAPVAEVVAPDAPGMANDLESLDAPGELEDAPVMDGELAEHEAWEEAVALEAGAATRLSASDTTIDSATVPAQEHTGHSAAATLDRSAQDTSADNGSAHAPTIFDVPTMPDINRPTTGVDSGPTAHSPKSPNGVILKPKSGRRSRGQQPATESAAKQPAKRRSNSSKRKQTT